MNLSTIKPTADKKHSSVKDNASSKKKNNHKAESPEQSQSPSNFEIDNEPKVIDGIDIQALAIKEEDLKRFHNTNIVQQLNDYYKEEEILVKRDNKNYYPTVEYKIAKLVPNKPLKPIDTSDSKGIKFDKIGDVLPHSILGSVEEYLREARLRGNKIEAPFDELALINNDKPMTGVYDRPTSKSEIEIDGGTNALVNWQRKMLERKRVQGHISKLLKRPSNQLVMNQADTTRQSNEIKTLMDRTLPLLDYGKGYRLGSEFWTQATKIGDVATGIFTTLTKSEKGEAPPIEIISKPDITLLETNLDLHQPNTTRYPWNKSQYLQNKLNKLQPLIKEQLPHYPDIAQLQVIGNLRKKESETNTSRESNKNEDTWVNPDILYKSSVVDDNAYLIKDETQEGLLADHPDVISQPIFGPALIFGGQMARWTGNSSENAGLIALESRLNFETKAGKRVSATFEIFNCGTTAIYFDWRRIPDSNPFDIVNAKTQRFYFDTRSSTILPGDMLKVNFIFKSQKGGLFTEKWEFLTSPKLLSGASLILTLRGIAIQEDKFKKTRNMIEQKLLDNEAELAAKEALEMILLGVRTPERPSSPDDAYVTDEEVFSKLNPNFYYIHETVEEIKALYDEFSAEIQQITKWNLSIYDFKEEIMNLPENNQKKQEFLSRLNANISSIAFNTYKPNDSSAYNICYSLLTNTIDYIVDEIQNVKCTLGLNTFHIEDSYPSIDIISNEYENWRKEFEIFKQQEIDRKNKLEKDKSKDKNKKGAPPANEKKDDKKKEVDQKKKPTPTPSTASKTKQGPPKSPVASDKDKGELRQLSIREMTQEQKVIYEIYLEKIKTIVYQIFIDMFDEMDTVLHDLFENDNIIVKLGRMIQQPKLIEPNFSDFID